MKKSILGLTLIIGLLLGGCKATQPKSQAIVEIAIKSAELQNTQVHILLGSDIDEFLKRTDIGIIDSRAEAEFENRVLDKRAILIEIKNGKERKDSLESFRGQLFNLDKNETWLIYCGIGDRSAEGTKIMVEEGFKNVYVLQGGLKAYDEMKK